MMPRFSVSELSLILKKYKDRCNSATKSRKLCLLGIIMMIMNRCYLDFNDHDIGLQIDQTRQNTANEITPSSAKL